MDENTKFLIERMDRHHESIRDELSDLRDKLDIIAGFKNKILGAAMVASGLISALMQYLTGGK